MSRIEFGKTGLSGLDRAEGKKPRDGLEANVYRMKPRMYERVNHQRGDRRGKTSGPLAWRSGDEAGGHNFKPLDLPDDDDDDDDDDDEDDDGDDGSEEADRVVHGRLSGIPVFHLRERECAIRVGTASPVPEAIVLYGPRLGNTLRCCLNGT